jgi:hypothetical protein
MAKDGEVESQNGERFFKNYCSKVRMAKHVFFFAILDFAKLAAYPCGYLLVTVLAAVVGRGRLGCACLEYFPDVVAASLELLL